mmetsp:Transcript_35565/g.70314  ORF Transcript_35565/g.70314 Transcript_35565/m.70314 type:complete len:253 (+) Transcript_35565:48-806(+)
MAASCTDYQHWVEHINREFFFENARNQPEAPDDIHSRIDMINPYAAGARYFEKGLANNYWNESAKTRLLISPNTECPMRSRRHTTHIAATRGYNMDRMPFLNSTAPPAKDAGVTALPRADEQKGRWKEASPVNEQLQNQVKSDMGHRTAPAAAATSSAGPSRPVRRGEGRSISARGRGAVRCDPVGPVAPKTARGHLSEMQTALARPTPRERALSAVQAQQSGRQLDQFKGSIRASTQRPRKMSYGRMCMPI